MSEDGILKLSPKVADSDLTLDDLGTVVADAVMDAADRLQSHIDALQARLTALERKTS